MESSLHGNEFTRNKFESGRLLGRFATRSQLHVTKHIRSHKIFVIKYLPVFNKCILDAV